MFNLIIITNLIILINGLYDNEINLECRGKRHENVTLTAYYPDYNSQGLERGDVDKLGKKLRTLQDYLDDRTSFVTLAMDDRLSLPYGIEVCVPELNQHFGHRIRLQVRDSSNDLDGSGYRRAEICVRTEIDSYDVSVNRQVALVFV